MTDRGKEPSAEQLLKALGHPLRRRILRRMGSEVTSPGKLAAGLEEPLASVSYHVRQLKKYRVVKSAGVRPVRGTLEHFYRLAIDVDWVRAALNDSPQEDGDGAQPPSS
jgi:DNA-binding transcriptional ArsR family regulator